MLCEADQRPSLVSALRAITSVHLHLYVVVLALRFEGESKPEYYVCVCVCVCVGGWVLKRVILCLVFFCSCVTRSLTARESFSRGIKLHNLSTLP